MNAIDLIASSALLALAVAVFNGENLECLLPCADTSDTSWKSMGYQRKASIHAGCTPDTPDTCQKTEVKCRTQKEAEKWASMM